MPVILHSALTSGRPFPCPRGFVGVPITDRETDEVLAELEGMDRGWWRGGVVIADGTTFAELSDFEPGSEETVLALCGEALGLAHRKRL